MKQITLPAARIKNTIRKQVAQSNLFAKLLRLIKKGSVPAFLIKRAAANGLIREELEMACRQVSSWEELPPVFAGRAGASQDKALYWMELGLPQRAGSQFLQASLWDFYAQLLTLDDFDQKRLIYARSAHNYRQVAPLFEYPALAIEIDYQSGQLKGYLRLPLPSSEQACPGVILVNGINSSKEELHYTENAFLKMGIATLSFDLPGFGESTDSQLDNCDLESLDNALFLFLSQQAAVDPGRLALHGLSLGGTLALRLAIQSPRRYKAIAALSTPYHLENNMRELLPSIRREVSCLTQGTEYILSDFAERTSIHDRLKDLDSALLVAGAGRDAIIPAQDSRRIYEASGSTDKKWIFVPNAGHCLYEMMPSLRYEIAQWIKQRL